MVTISTQFRQWILVWARNIHSTVLSSVSFRSIYVQCTILYNASCRYLHNPLYTALVVLPPILHSSFYWASVANAPNVLQPYWLIVLPLGIPDLTASLFLWGPSGQRWEFYEPSYFRMFQLSPLVVFKRSQQPKAELHGREMADEFCLKMPDFHVTFRDLLRAVNLRHGTDGFTFPTKEGVLRIFSVGFEPANLGTKGQHATSRPLKPF